MKSHIHHTLILLVAITGITLLSTPSISSDTHQSISSITVKSTKENSLPQLWKVKINGKSGYVDARTTYKVELQSEKYPLKTQISPAEITEFNRIFEFGKFNHQKAIALRKRLQPLADQNDAVACYWLAKTYNLEEFGIRKESDRQSALKWYHRSAELDYAPAAYFLYRAYFSGWMGLQKDENESSKWLHEAKKKSSGKLLSEILMEFVFFSDPSVKSINLRTIPKNAGNYLEYLRQIYILTPSNSWVIHKYGNALYEAKRYTEALAVLINSDNAFIWQKIGQMYEQGLGTPIDIEKALFWYKKVAIEGKTQENGANPISTYGRLEIYRLICLKKITTQQAAPLYSPEKYQSEFAQFSDSKCNYGS
ncbi:tetratricopeptide repeat protein [Nostoc sp. FACHB-190]|uniref:tetratricopeptide repeat protein n=1 Tax=Nostoc sp. FACHB-190 TaxID=2692838 RepID=UPI0016851D12|nr:tetratricopeptide repeat protein [Nostoc sp. FACHB-190]MBD2297585.1 sel1 repeat family protein [Nostoc sp. FACHB-190]